MKTILLALLCSFYFSLQAFGQGVAYSGQITNSQGIGLPGVTVNVFTITTTGSPAVVNCVTPQTVYRDIALTQPYSTLTTNGFGSYYFFIAPASSAYGYQVSGAPTADTTCYPFSVPVAPGSSPTFSSLTVSGAVSAGSAAVTGAISAGSLAAGASAFSSTVEFKGDPWYDVRSYGAVCNGTTDDTTSIQNAINAAHAAGGAQTVFFPAITGAQCKFTTPLTIYSSITLMGGSFGMAFATPGIVYTGTSTPAISCSSGVCVDSKILNLTIAYNNSGFTGTLVNMNSANSGTNLIEGVTFTGGSITTAAYLLDISSSSSAVVRYSRFGGTTKMINAAGANGAVIAWNSFGGITGTITSTWIDGCANGLTIDGNTFEFAGLPNTVTGTILDCHVTSGAGSHMSGNWIGDMASGWTGTLINSPNGMALAGNTLSAGASTGATMISSPSSTAGFSYSGNFAQGTWSTAFSLGAAESDLYIQGNTWGTITTFLSGTNPSSGEVVDNTGKIRFYGTGTRIDSLNINGAGTSQSGITGTGASLVTNTAPTISAPVLTGSTSITRILASGTAATSCAVTGAGTTATCSLVTTNTDSYGVMRIASAGTGQASSGTITLNLSAALGSFAVCDFKPANTSTAWNARVSVLQSSFSNTAPAGSWDNNSAALVASNSYDISYKCVGE